MFELLLVESLHPYTYLDSCPQILKFRSRKIRPLDLHPYLTPTPESEQLSLCLFIKFEPGLGPFQLY